MTLSHVVWDWNGTLLDDFDIMVEATSSSCFGLLGRPVTAEEYRRHFARPVPLLYEGIFGRPLAPGEWQLVNSRFHTSYGSLVSSEKLRVDALTALRTVRQAGCTQSLLSMWDHRELTAMLDTFGIGSEFVRAEGVESISDGSGKYQHLVNHLGKLRVDLGRCLDPATLLVIGDSLDDAEAARNAGTRCVLVEGGSHHASDLAAGGAPVAKTLTEALRVGIARS